MILNFRSDNCSPILPEIIEALGKDMRSLVPSNGGEAYSDNLDDEVARRLSQTFNTELGVLSALSGTGANALAIATLLANPDAPIVCHEDAHINVWEEGAALYLAQAQQFSLLKGAHGQISVTGLKEHVLGAGCLMTGGVLALTTPTEAGTIYPLEHLRALSEIAHAAGMSVYLDGARLGSALAALALAPSDFVNATGIDAFSFGGTKLGCLAAEAVLFVKPHQKRMERAAQLHRAGGQRIARRRFVNVQILRLLEDDLWLDVARRQNENCAAFLERMGHDLHARLLHPCETNQAFLRHSERLSGAFERASIRFTLWPDNSLRLVFCHHHTRGDIETLADVVRANI